MDILDGLEVTGETEAMWQQLRQISLEESHLKIAERCAAALGDVAQLRYLRKVCDARCAMRGAQCVVFGVRFVVCGVRFAVCWYAVHAAHCVQLTGSMLVLLCSIHRVGM
jgi:hypothetical protein